ncbi:MAG TPA: bifunctional UDP-4-keto-pentose/UDP-xylose synthase [bacterium]|nr:bifunctional UDP-4-keto-pentose/UDP-xylose synthase [bacterium]HOL48382.1 bifunctional UDP-4-keto-pentose/UDP-xylose synthase [bacterium]HPQ19708.1 bifunctional UDP-4-keto-pentose/UDP-xylose synthase [bacterium]
MNILILGVNGFIGNALTKKILETTDWNIFGIDISDNRLEDCLSNKRFKFYEGDIMVNKEWIEYHIKISDIIIPLVAIATPKTYVTNPLAVYELDFEANIEIVKYCVKYNKRIIFPSTSEVYGMCTDEKFNEEKSNLILGPIQKQRWIYSCCKQLIDRVIYAYGWSGKLNYTLFRPFNWIGPKLDNIDDPKEGSSRVVTQFIGCIKRNEPIKITNDGSQRRSFTYIDDGIDCLMKIIKNENQAADKKIFNIGNPDNDISIKGLAEKLILIAEKINPKKYKRNKIKIEYVSYEDYYGASYQDMLKRVPDISNAIKYLNWKPKVNLETALYNTLHYYLVKDKKNNIQ